MAGSIGYMYQQAEYLVKNTYHLEADSIRKQCIGWNTNLSYVYVSVACTC